MIDIVLQKEEFHDQSFSYFRVHINSYSSITFIFSLKQVIVSKSIHEFQLSNSTFLNQIVSLFNIDLSLNEYYVANYIAACVNK